MSTIEGTPTQADFWKALSRFILLLLLAQMVRAALAWLLIKPIGLDNNVASPLTFIGMAIVLWLAVRPSWHDLGLNLREMKKGEWIMYGMMAAIILILLVANFLMDQTLWLTNLYGVVIVPIVEEALFRGLGWSKLSKALPKKWNGLLTWILISILFGLWHLGYTDVVALYADQPVSLPALPAVMVWKVLVGGFIGGMAGLARWKFDKLPGAVFIHALFNIFGR
jgi:membrane protease YdiL (CAAX protease family)